MQLKSSHRSATSRSWASKIEETDVPLGQTDFFRCGLLGPPLPLEWEWGAAGSCLPRALVGFDVGGEGERVLAGPGVVGREYGWCRFPVILFAPEHEAPEFVRERGCEGVRGSGKFAGLACFIGVVLG